MNRNTIRTKVKVTATACCMASAIMIGSTSFVSEAGLTAGVIDVASKVAEPTESNLTAGVTSNLSKHIEENLEEKAVEKSVTEQNSQETDNNATKSSGEESEFSNIGISSVEDYVNIRETPSTDGEIVGKLYSDSAVTILGEEGEWYKVNSGNCQGYIKREYIITGDEELAKSKSTRVAIVNTEDLNIRDEMSTEGNVLGQVTTGEQLLVLEEAGEWVKVSTDEGEGYVSGEFVRCVNHYKVAESKEEEAERLRKAEEARKAAEEARKAAEEAELKKNSESSNAGTTTNSNEGSGSSNTGTTTNSSEESSSSNTETTTKSSEGSGSTESSDKTYNAPSGGSGQDVVNYAKQFVGNPYVYGGTSLTNGADCSGFIMSVYAAFGQNLPHSSSALRGVGYEVSTSDMQPGDIICYDGHAAIYVGGDTVVHASNQETGIKYTSPANYRSIVTVRRIF